MAGKFDWLNVALVCLLTLNVLVSAEECPVRELISPDTGCQYNYEFCWIYCFGHKDLDLTNIFGQLSQSLNKSEKHFKKFYLKNTHINELNSSTTKDITFDYIEISGTKLRTIGPDAFDGTNRVTKKLNIFNNYYLSSDSIYKLMNSFANIEEILELNNNLTRVHSNAFKPLAKLNYIIMDKINQLDSHAFQHLDSLMVLSLFNGNLKYVPDYAFAFKNASETKLYIDLKLNKLRSESFHIDALKNIKRPTYLDLGYNYMTYLSQDIFQPFLNDNDKNSVFLLGNHFDCSDCRNNWLKQNTDYKNKVLFLQCSNGQEFNDPNNFALCSK